MRIPCNCDVRPNKHLFHKIYFSFFFAQWFVIFRSGCFFRPTILPKYIRCQSGTGMIFRTMNPSFGCDNIFSNVLNTTFVWAMQNTSILPAQAGEKINSFSSSSGEEICLQSSGNMPVLFLQFRICRSIANNAYSDEMPIGSFVVAFIDRTPKLYETNAVTQNMKRHLNFVFILLFQELSRIQFVKTIGNYGAGRNIPLLLQHVCSLPLASRDPAY